MKIKDLVIHETGATGTIRKIYNCSNTGKVVVQIVTDTKVIFDSIDKFKLVDCLLLRCNNCNQENYETKLEVNDNGMYMCTCGSSTFTPLNLEILM